MFEFMQGSLWGIRYFIWFYFLLSIILFTIVAIYFFREWIRKQYYQIRFPESLILVKIFYPSNIYKEYWRLIPDHSGFKIDGKRYPFSNDKAVKFGDFLAKEKDMRNNRQGESQYEITIDGKKYDVMLSKAIKWRWNKYPEAHYKFNVPAQIDYSQPGEGVSFTAKELNDFEESNLFMKMLTISGDRAILSILIVLGVINLLISAYFVAKDLGLIGGAVQ